MQDLKDVKKLNPRTAIFPSRVSELKLAPMGVEFHGGVIDGDEDRRARERIQAINRRLAKLQPGRVADAEEYAALTDERGALAAIVGRELGVAVIPRSGTATLGPGRHAEAATVLDFLRSHRLHEDGPTHAGTFWEVTS
jgi:hypothetical protein